MAFHVFNDSRTLDGAAPNLLTLFWGDTLILGRDAFWSASNLWSSQAIKSSGHATIRVAGQVYAAHHAICSTGEGDLVDVLASGIVGSHAYSGICLFDSGEVRNAGEVFGEDAVTFGDGGVLTNSGRISGAHSGVTFVSGSDNRAQLVNSGAIEGAYGVSIGSEVSTLVANSGTIHGALTALSIRGSGVATVENSGKIVGGVAIYGGWGADTVINTGSIMGAVSLGDGDDVFDSSRGTIVGQIDGGAGDDVLIGSASDDRLSGGAGADLLDGGGGRDVAVYDTVGGGITANLADASQNTGDAAGDTFVSIEGLTGGWYADVLTGDAGANTLDGGGGSDVLDGGAGADVLRGGLGDDTFVVDNRRDQVIELAGAGTDTVRASISYTLGEPIENLTLEGKGNIDGVGNALANVLLGNAGRNTLSGGAGEDRLDGGGGADVLAGGNDNDVYLVDHRGDRIVEDAEGGIDRVVSSVDYVLPEWVEQMELTGAAIRGTGNGGANVIAGTIGDNILDGGAGSDILIGWGGADRFTFSTALDGEWNVDTVADWDVGMDRIALDRAVFQGAGKTLTASMFARGTEALDADDRLPYDASTGDLRWDADGVGGTDAVLFAHVEGAPALQLSDVMLVG